MKTLYFSDVSPISEVLFWNLTSLKKGSKDDEMTCVYEIVKCAGTFCCKGDSLEGEFKYICI